MERAIRLISADHREKGQSGGRAGPLYWTQSPTNEMEEGNEQVIINMLSVMSFKDQCRYRNCEFILINEKADLFTHCSGIKNLVPYLSST